MCSDVVVETDMLQYGECNGEKIYKADGNKAHIQSRLAFTKAIEPHGNNNFSAKMG